MRLDRYVWISSSVVIGVVKMLGFVEIRIQSKNWERIYLRFRPILLGFIVRETSYWEVPNIRGSRIRLRFSNPLMRIISFWIRLKFVWLIKVCWLTQYILFILQILRSAWFYFCGMLVILRLIILLQLFVGLLMRLMCWNPYCIRMVSVRLLFWTLNTRIHSH